MEELPAVLSPAQREALDAFEPIIMLILATESKQEEMREAGCSCPTALRVHRDFGAPTISVEVKRLHSLEVVLAEPPAPRAATDCVETGFFVRGGEGEELSPGGHGAESAGICVSEDLDNFTYAFPKVGLLINHPSASHDQTVS